MVRERELGVHSEPQLEYRYKELDPSGLGYVTVAEYVICSLRDAFSRSGLRSLDVFMAFDEDGSGDISVEEFRKTLRSWGFKVSRAALEMAFAKLDFVDKSGDISYLEFHRVLRSRPALPENPKARELAIQAKQPRAYRRGTELEGKLEIQAANLEWSEDPRKLVAQLREVLSEHLARILDLMRTWDEDNSGTVDKKEWRKALRSLGIQLKRDVLDNLFDQLDADRSGELDYHELHKHLTPPEEKPSSPNNQSKMSVSMSEADTKARTLNGFNIAKHDPFRTVADQLEDAIRESRARLYFLFREWDENGDGKLSKEELLVALQKLGLPQVEQAREAVEDIFKRLDKDGSATVEYRELVSGLRKRNTAGRRGPTGSLPHQRTLVPAIPSGQPPSPSPLLRPASASWASMSLKRPPSAASNRVWQPRALPPRPRTAHALRGRTAPEQPSRTALEQRVRQNTETWQTFMRTSASMGALPYL